MILQICRIPFPPLRILILLLRPHTIMKLSHSLLIASLFAVAAQTGCAVSSDSGNEESSFDSLAASSIKNPTLLGEVSLGETSSAVFTKDDTYHAWDIYVSERAAARFYTLPLDAKGKAVDTLLTSTKGTNNSWARIWRKMATPTTVWSRLRTHNGGHYRLSPHRQEPQSPRIPRRISAPAFGRTSAYSDAPSTDPHGSHRVVRERTIDSAAQLSDMEKAQVVDSMKASSYGDATTVEEALERVGGGEINLLHLYDQTNGKTYLAVEYGAGDNSYERITRPRRQSDRPRRRPTTAPSHAEASAPTATRPKPAPARFVAPD
jgi:hypothetical protein